MFADLKCKYDIGNIVDFKFRDGNVYTGMIVEVTPVYKSWPDARYNTTKIMYTIYTNPYPGMTARILEKDINPTPTIDDWV